MGLNPILENNPTYDRLDLWRGRKAFNLKKWVRFPYRLSFGEKMDNPFSDLPPRLFEACCDDMFDDRDHPGVHRLRFLKFVTVGLIPLPQMVVLFPDWLDDEI